MPHAALVAATQARLTADEQLSLEDVFGIEVVSPEQFQDFAYVSSCARPFERFLAQFAGTVSQPSTLFYNFERDRSRLLCADPRALPEQALEVVF